MVIPGQKQNLTGKPIPAGQNRFKSLLIEEMLLSRVLLYNKTALLKHHREDPLFPALGSINDKIQYDLSSTIDKTCHKIWAR